MTDYLATIAADLDREPWICASCGQRDVTPSISEPEVCVDCSH